MGLPPAVSANTTLLPTIMVAAEIEMQLVRLEQVPALSHMTKESSDDKVTRLSLPTGLQVHDLGFEIGIGNDPF